MNVKAGRRGFTLIELLAVVSIIAILSAIGLATFSGSQKRARDARRMADLETVRSALELYRADNPTIGYPAVAYGALPLTPSYLSQLPDDPLSTQDYSYAGGGTTYTLSATREIIAPLAYTIGPP